mgnify:FL=1
MVSLLGIQLIGIIFGIFMLYLTFLNYKQDKFTSKEWLAWNGMWIIFFAITLFPSLLNPILETLNLYRAMDFYISLGFLFFILIIFYVYTITRTNQQKLELIVRKLAFENIENEPKIKQSKKQSKRKK